MRVLPFLFVLVVPALGGAAQAAPRGGFHHGGPSNWHLAPHDGSSPHDFGRMLSHHDRGVTQRDVQEQREPLRLNNFQVSDAGARLGVGFVAGRRLGLRLKSPF
jgi:hypothetical protein